MTISSPVNTDTRKALTNRQVPPKSNCLLVRKHVVLY